MAWSYGFTLSPAVSTHGLEVWIVKKGGRTMEKMTHPPPAPALSLIGPKPSMVKPQLKVANMPRAASAMP